MMQAAAFFLLLGIFFYQPKATAADRASKIAIPDDFRMVDQFHRAHQWSSYLGVKSLRILRTHKDCLTSNQQIKFRSIANTKEAERTIYFTTDGAENFRDYAEVREPVLFDRFAYFANRYELYKPGDYADIKIPSGELLKRGRIEFETPKKNCSEVTSLNNPIFFKRNILPKLEKYCLTCHLSYEKLNFLHDAHSIQNFAKMMAKTIRTYRMPPTGPDTMMGTRFTNQISPLELRALYDWLERGAPMEPHEKVALNQRIMRAQKEISASPTHLRQKPDLVLAANSDFKIPAQGPFQTKFSLVHGPTQQDLWIVAGQMERNVDAVHHSMLIFGPENVLKAAAEKPGQSTAPWLQNAESLQVPVKVFRNGTEVGSLSRRERVLFSVLRWTNLYEAPRGTALFIPKGSYLGLEDHYEPTGNLEINRTRVYLYTHKGKQTPTPVERIGLFPKQLRIAPHEEVEIVSELSVDKKMQLHAFAAHLHLRGRDVKLFIRRANSTREDLLISIPFYSPHGSPVIELAEPVVLEPGSLVRTVVRYDNTAANQANPDPNLGVKVGYGFYDEEMHSVRLVVSYPHE